jgi:uncharacterized membrane protein YgaE (UPF0421/DUF939 family)
LSWFLAQRLFGHQQPIFAAITAIVCLAPGLPSHTKQTVGLLLGVATGILVGELSLVLLDDIPLLRITLAAFFSTAMTGSVRMIDVAIGAAVGFFFSQVLLTPDPSNRSKEQPDPQPELSRDT